MKDKWMNMGYEEDELKPFIEPIADFSDEKRIETLVILFLQPWCMYNIFVLAKNYLA
jgi:hypothetical protein